jgi:hypothetical protein
MFDHFGLSQSEPETPRRKSKLPVKAATQETKRRLDNEALAEKKEGSPCPDSKDNHPLSKRSDLTVLISPPQKFLVAQHNSIKGKKNVTRNRTKRLDQSRIPRPHRSNHTQPPTETQRPTQRRLLQPLPAPPRNRHPRRSHNHSPHRQRAVLQRVRLKIPSLPRFQNQRLPKTDIKKKLSAEPTSPSPAKPPQAPTSGATACGKPSPTTST